MDVITESLIRQFQTDRGLEKLRKDEVFETFAAYCIVGQHHEDDFDPDQIRMGGTGDLGIDAAAVLVNGELFTDASTLRRALKGGKDLRVTFVVIQAKATERFQSDVFSQLAEGLHHIFRRDAMTFNASAKVLNLRECVEIVYGDLKKLTNQLPRLSVYYVTGGKTTAALTARRDAARDRLEQLKRFHEVSVRAIGAEELRELYRRANDAISATIKMERRLIVPSMPGVKQALIGVVRAKELVENLLADPAGNIRNVLFHENVRLFLGYGEPDANGERRAVNAQIKKSLQSREERERFAILSNGITIVARKLVVESDELHMTDFHIVNGCQTCHVLFDEADQLDDNVLLNVKIIETTDENVISSIVIATNRQNAVTPDDINARDELHREIESFFKAQQERTLYYERLTNQYAVTEIEKTRIITRPQLTKAFAAIFLDEAHRVTRLSEVVTSRGDDLFRPKDGAPTYFVAASVAYRIEWLLRNGYLPSTYGPAKFHLMAAVKAYLLGPDRMPTAVRAHKAACEIILSHMWNQAKAEVLVNSLVPALLSSWNQEGDGMRLSEAVRTSKFRLNMLNATLALRDGRSTTSAA